MDEAEWLRRVRDGLNRYGDNEGRSLRDTVLNPVVDADRGAGVDTAAVKQWGDPLERARQADAELGVKWALIAIAEALQKIADQQRTIPNYLFNRDDSGYV